MIDSPIARLVCFFVACCTFVGTNRARGESSNVVDERPNIVFAFADDWGRYASCYAALKAGGLSDAVQTPNIDRVAREGALFTNAFVSAPSCTPCRSSLLSGRHFWQCGRASILLGAVWDYSIQSYPLLLEENGYHLGHTYKVWGPGTPANAPYGEKRTSYMKHGGKFNGFSQRVSEGVGKGQAVEAAKSVLLDEVRANMSDCLDDADKADKPFCYWFGPTNVHRKWIQGSGRALWGIDPDTLIGKVPSFLPDIPVMREDLADYLGEVMAFDAAVGVLLDELENRGLLENTLVVVSGDHGAPGFPNGKCNLYDFGTHVALMAMWPGRIPAGRVVTDFVSLPDLAPTFLEAGGVEVPDAMSASSLVPLLLSDKSGRIDETRDAAFTGRERHVDTAQHDYTPYPMRAIRTDEYLYIRNFRPERWPMGDAPGFGNDASTADLSDYVQLRENTRHSFADLDASPAKAELVTRRAEAEIAPFVELTLGQRPAEELYDLASDPHQIRNVAGDPEYDAVRKTLADRLTAKLTATGDPRLIKNGQFYETSPMIDPAPARKKPAQRK